MTSRVWRPWYHSLEAWNLHQRAAREGPLFRATQATLPPKITLTRALPQYLQTSWQRYQQAPNATKRYCYDQYLLSRVDEQYYLLGRVSNEELQVQDFLLEEVAERWHHR
jgi:hypothetical protein